MAAVKRGRIPFAKWDPIKGRSLLRNKPVRMNVHIAVARSADIYGPGKGPGGTYAGAYNPKSGPLRQHQEIDRKTYADLDANGQVFAVEHEGWPGDDMTDNQIDNDARLFALLVTDYGTPNRIATVGNTHGLSWHRLGCRGNFAPFDRNDPTTWSGAQTGQRWTTSFGKTCPTDKYIRRIPEIFDRAQAYIAGETVRPKVPSGPQKDKTPVTGAKKKTPVKSRKYTKLLVDGVRGKVTVTAWQILLAAIDEYTGRIDGQWGPLSVKAEQRWLAGLGYYRGRIDGAEGPMTKRALQSFLRSKGLYKGLLDGKRGPMTIKAEQRYLNAQRKYL